jgi:4,5-DOPA dioxygenase extradiol
VHNLRLFFAQPERRQPYGWAERFETQMQDAIAARDHARVLDYLAMGQDAQLAAPTPEHLWPLFYVLGASREQDALSFPVTGFDGSALSMLSVQFG